MTSILAVLVQNERRVPSSTGVIDTVTIRKSPELLPIGQGEGAVAVEDRGVCQLKWAAGAQILEDDPAGQSIENQGVAGGLYELG